MTATTPRIYVGTYAKYNSGSIEGAWLDLTDYSDKEGFEEACQALHGPGEHEFMFQDHEGIPDRFISESSLSDNVWTDWVELDDDDKELLQVYLGEVNQNGTLEEAKEACWGRFSSEEDWATEFWEETGMLESIPTQLRGYIDYTAYARDSRLSGDMTFVRKGGEVWCFRNN
jgi:antirestriction protein